MAPIMTSLLLFIVLNSILVPLFLLLILLVKMDYLQATASVGLVGNVSLFFAILFCTKFRKSSQCVYILAKAIVDSLYLAAYNGEFHAIRSVSFPICVTQDSLLLFARHASVATIIAMLVERFLAAMCPDEHEKCSKDLNRWKCFLVLSVPIALWELLLGMTSFLPNNDHQVMIGMANSTFVPQCVRVQNVFRRISSFTFYVLNFFLPILLFFLANFLIGFKVRYSMANVKFMERSSTARRRSTSSANLAKDGIRPMLSPLFFIFPLAFVLLQSPIYILHFAYPPARLQEYGDNVAVMEMKGAADLANLCSFALNLPLFSLAKIID